ncbi:hypothetical protein [Acrocarpospora catenulata]|uniref:hypothetical protein n=1 Tax=Acrocarpospora catenulata TaxID=2836182 RepID=UPI001BD9D064|nr:hypothetical protein [Acrocarpospora catenulata]
MIPNGNGAPPLPAPTRIGQATAVEQSRAVAEVHAAIIVAQQCPRDVQAARQAMHDSCQQMFMAEKAFFRFRRGDGQISGETVHLARELARCWQNIQYNVGELRRDDAAGQSEVIAWAWDVQMNTRSSTTFIVPHGRDKDGQVVPLISLRDIYENNANAGARRVREMIFNVLPPWFIEEAKEVCTRTLAGGGGKPLAQLIDEALLTFAGLGVSADQMEQKVGRPKGNWNPYDLAQFRVIYRSLQRREVTVEDEFPPARVTAAEVLQAAQQPAAPAPTEQVTSEQTSEGDSGRTGEGADGWPPVTKPGTGGDPA